MYLSRFDDLPSGTAPAGKARQSEVGQQSSIASPVVSVASGPTFTVRYLPVRQTREQALMVAVIDPAVDLRLKTIV